MKLRDSRFIQYLIKFLAAFAVLYFGTMALIAITVPGGYYSAFADQYLDYPSLLRMSLLQGAKLFVVLRNYHADIVGDYYLKMQNGSSVQLVYSCLGYGLMSFWAAFIFANAGTATKKTTWILGGFIALWLINVARIGLLLIAFNRHTPIPFGLDHHTLYNIAAYLLIFFMIWLYDWSQRTPKKMHSIAA